MVFVLVVVFTLIQSPLMAPLARRLGLVHTEQLVEISVESAPLESVHAELLELTVPHGSRLIFVEVGELRLPELGAMVSLIVREGRTFVPDVSSRLREGDRLLVVVGPDGRSAAQERIAAVSQDGRAASWRPVRGPGQRPVSGPGERSVSGPGERSGSGRSGSGSGRGRCPGRGEVGVRAEARAGRARLTTSGAPEVKAASDGRAARWRERGGEREREPGR